MEINFFFFLFLKINVFNLFSFKLELFLNEIKICLLLVLQLFATRFNNKNKNIESTGGDFILLWNYCNSVIVL